MRNINRDNKIKLVRRIFIAMYFVFMIIFTSLYPVRMLGEWDDYALPTVSFINDNNFFVSQNDIGFAKEIFPEIIDDLNNYRLSDYRTIDGDELSWYNPTYSIMCVPMVWFLYLLGLSPIHGFFYTNIALALLVQLFIDIAMDISEERKLILTMILTLNPIMMYYMWASSEVAIFAFVSLSLLCWHNGWEKRAAFLISVAGLMNSAVMSMGMIMIIRYLISNNVMKELIGNKMLLSIKTIKKILAYGACYLISFFPFIYSYMLKGVAVTYVGVIETDTWIQRFIAYLLDLNFGYLPYYNLLFVLVVVVLVMSVYKKNYNYIWCVSMGFWATFVYSFWPHVNCGMLGMARYNVWGGVPLLIGLVLYSDNIFKNQKIIYLKRLVEYIGVAVMGLIMMYYSNGYNASCMHMTPIASAVLNNYPGIYNPLPGTFYNRIYSEDGTPEIITPIVYLDSDGYVRKILASSKDKEMLISQYEGIAELDNIYYLEQIKKLKDSNKYLSFGKNYHIIGK